jgi:hypothetical protein
MPSKHSLKKSKLFAAYPYSIEDGSIAIYTGILSSGSEFNAFGIVALEPIELQNYRVLEGYIKKKMSMDMYSHDCLNLQIVYVIMEENRK